MVLTCITLFVLLVSRLFYWHSLGVQGPAIVVSDEKTKKIMKGPKSLPIIGSLHLLGGPEGPFDAFTKLSKIYGDIYEIQLGVAKCVVVSSYEMIMEVLIKKGDHFGGRPNFYRYHALFGGDRNNSLALCDWSDLQKKRRSLARHYCSPRNGTIQVDELCKYGTFETNKLLSQLEEPKSQLILNGKESIKPLILASIGNMFMSYMCSKRFDYNDKNYMNLVRNYDEIFWDINQGYAVDFLPWLKPIYGKIMARLNNWSTDIRSFILKEIVNERLEILNDENNLPKDLTSALLIHLTSKDTDLTWDHVLFELEDFLGGHSAVGNLVMLILAYVAMLPDVQKKIQDECKLIGIKNKRLNGLVTLDDRSEMPYTDSVIWETLRISSSPIVPHVTSIDTEINGYNITKDTVVFINNYELNLGEKYWGKNSKEFIPERFFQITNGSIRVVKPAYFLPFSTGKRTCVGQKLVQGFAFVIVTSLLTRYDIYPIDDNLKQELRPACVAVPPDTFNLQFKPRNITT